jgi:hypothetical protein
MISKNIISNESQGYEIFSHVISKIEFRFKIFVLHANMTYQLLELFF